MVNYFWESIDAILKDDSVTLAIVRCYSINWKTIIFHCSKNYGILTDVTWLKVVPSMTDPISLNEGYGNFSLILIGYVMFGAVFNQVTQSCRATVIFGTMKDDSLSINTLASNNWLCHRNVFQNGVNAVSKMADHFCQKAQNFVYFIWYDSVQISPACGPNTHQIMCGQNLDFQCQDQ